MTPELYGQIRERAKDRCESCGGFADLFGQVDHFFGRARAEGFEACWFLCPECHHRKTNNRPTARWWLERFIAHCTRQISLGASQLVYAPAIERARSRLEGIVAVREAEARRR